MHCSSRACHSLSLQTGQVREVDMTDSPTLHFDHFAHTHPVYKYRLVMALQTLPALPHREIDSDVYLRLTRER